MDPTSSDSSLQNTSPSPDPAAVSSLTEAYAAQAEQLAAHHHQLNLLTTLTEELVRAIHDMRASSSQSGTSQAPTAVPPAPETLSHTSPRLALPEKFNGDPEKCKGFILQCSLYLTQQPALYTEAGKITFVCSLFTRKALEWITAVWRGDGAVFPSFEVFLQRFKAVFEHSKEGKSAGDHLLELSQRG